MGMRRVSVVLVHVVVLVIIVVVVKMIAEKNFMAPRIVVVIVIVRGGGGRGGGDGWEAAKLQQIVNCSHTQRPRTRRQRWTTCLRRTTPCSAWTWSPSTFNAAGMEIQI